MTNTLVFDPDKIAPVVQRLIGKPSPFAACTAIGVEEDGEVIGGVVYEDYTGHNIFMHVGSAQRGRWMTREFLRAASAYPFIQLGCDRVTSLIDQTNVSTQKFIEHLGSTLECKLRGAARDGSDILVYVMWRDQCRFLGDRYVRCS